MIMGVVGGGIVGVCVVVCVLLTTNINVFDTTWTPTLFANAQNFTHDELLAQLCYEVSWNLASETPRRQAIRPINTFPLEHAIVQYNYCNENIQQGDTIPASGLWSTGSGCQSVSGGELFYAYNQPDGASSNTGFEESEADLLYFVVDEDLRVSFVLVHDVPNDATGGNIKLEIDSPDLGGKGVQILIADDGIGTGSNCLGGGSGDCMQWNTNTGYGAFRWAWAPCCTDGLVLGHIYDLEWRFNLRYVQTTGITKFKIGNYDDRSAKMDFLVLDETSVRQSGIEVKAVQCSSYCGAKTSCGECINDPQCGWCPSRGCLPNGFEAACESGWQDYGCCANCAALSGCTECVTTPGCGWSFERGECLSGSTQLGSCDRAVWYQLNQPNTTMCEYVPGPVFQNENDTIETGVVVDWCSGHGQYDFDARTCECDYGYFGPGCANECPGGAATPCSNQGTCNTLTGECYCDCGFAGRNCSIEGCPCTEEFCFLFQEGSCPDVCGRNFGGSCTGFDFLELSAQGQATARIADPLGRCACESRFWGPYCNYTCPGIAYDGSGSTCGGHGTCNVFTGACECDSCYELNGGGICVDKPCPTCMHSGQCVCNNGNKECNCPGFWSGEVCETCDCLNGGTCNSISGACSCPVGFVGDQCQFECHRDVLCHGHGTCNALLEKCDCDEFYIGVATHECEFYCGPETCLNGGTCVPEDGSCDCVLGYFGDSCENNVCQLDPCLNGATCSLNSSATFGYQCACTPGYEGKDCEIDIDECALGHNCRGAECIDEVNGFNCSCYPNHFRVNDHRCDCPAGYTGYSCEIDIDECALGNLCFGAACVDEVNGYHCDCLDGHIRVTPFTCVSINECDARLSNCDDHAVCTNTQTSYTCTCIEGYDGDGTECHDVDECATETHDCVDIATCVNSQGSYSCECPATHNGDGFTTGTGCQTYCKPNPCEYGGTCSVDADGFSCECLDGYTGETCGLNATVCAALTPCIEDATCLPGPVVEPDEFPLFYCNCSFGFDDPACRLLQPSKSSASSAVGASTAAVIGVGAGVLLIILIVIIVVRQRQNNKAVVKPEAVAIVAPDNGVSPAVSDEPREQAFTTGEAVIVPNTSNGTPTTYDMDDDEDDFAFSPNWLKDGNDGDALVDDDDDAEVKPENPYSSVAKLMANTDAGDSDLSDLENVED